MVSRPLFEGLVSESPSVLLGLVSVSDKEESGFYLIDQTRP